MTNPERIKILQIKDLKLIFFFDVANDLSKTNGKTFLGLKIVYGDDQVLSHEYTSEYFKEFVLKVLSVYKNEKESRKIMFLNDISKEIMESVDSKDYQDNSNKTFTQLEPICMIASRNFQIRLIESYIKDLSESILLFFYDNDKKIGISNMVGYRNRYLINYSVDGVNYSFPIVLIKNGDDQYIFKIAGIDGNSTTISGDIKINNGNVDIHWSDSSKTLIGKNLYRSSGSNEKSVSYNNKVIEFDDEQKQINSDEKNLISFYLNLFNLDNFDSGIKTVSDNFVLSKSELINQESTENLSKKTFCHIGMNKEFIHILHSKRYGVSKYKDSLVIPFHEEMQEITFVPFEIERKKYLLAQRRYLPTETMKGDYKPFVNRFSYSVFEARQIDNLLKENVVLDSFSIETPIETIEEVKEYIKTGRRCK